MAHTMYLSLTGKNTGPVKGDCTQAGREDKILVYNFDHTVEIPRDTHTGLATGQRIHGPVEIVKHKDQATPYLFKMCCSGERIEEFILQCFRIDEKGKEEHYFSIMLENAIVVRMREYTPMTFLPENKPYHDMDAVQFTYEKITWIYDSNDMTRAANIETSDDWRVPNI